MSNQSRPSRSLLLTVSISSPCLVETLGFVGPKPVLDGILLSYKNRKVSKCSGVQAWSGIAFLLSVISAVVILTIVVINLLRASCFYSFSSHHIDESLNSNGSI